MDAIWLPGRVDRETEFVGGLHAACGPNAAAMAERWADQSKLTTLDVYHRMRDAGRCDADGAATLSALAADAQAAGYRADVLAYRNPMPEATWRAFFQRHVGQQAIVFETANGQALHDALSGKGENATNLHYHFVMVAGWHPGGVSQHPQARGRTLPAGWWCADGDNFVTGDVLQFYADDVLAAARPVAAMAVYARVAIEGGDERMGIPTGWKDDAARETLTAPNGVTVTQGMRKWVLAHPWDPTDWPLAEKRYVDSVEPGNPSIGKGARQDFRMTSLGWTEQRNVYRIWAGQDIVALEKSLAQATAQVAQLTQQVAALQAAPPPTTGTTGAPTATTDPAATKAEAAIKALAEAMGTMKAEGEA